MAMRRTIVNLCVLMGLLSAACSPAAERTANDDGLNASNDELEESTGTYWAQYGRTARRTSYNPFETSIGAANVANLVNEWGCCEGETPSIALSHGRLFTGGVTISGVQVTLSARSLDPATGVAHWTTTRTGDDSTFDTDEGPGRNLTVGYGTVHLHQFGFSYLFSTAGGVPKGTSYLGPDSQAQPVLKNRELVYSGNSDISSVEYTVTAADADTGAVSWSKPQRLYRWEVEGALAFADGKVFTLTDAHRLIALDAATGNTVWTGAAAAGRLGAPSVYSGRVLVVSRPNTVQAYDERTGVVSWQSTLAATVTTGDEDAALASSAPAVGENSVYVVLQATTGLAVARLDLNTGAKQWERLLPESPQSGLLSKALANGVVYVGGSAGNLYAIDAQSGTVLSTFALGGPVVEIIVGDGRVHVSVGGHGVRTLSLPN